VYYNHSFPLFPPRFIGNIQAFFASQLQMPAICTCSSLSFVSLREGPNAATTLFPPTAILVSPINNKTNQYSLTVAKTFLTPS
jgi:hypothetical protein